MRVLLADSTPMSLASQNRQSQNQRSQNQQFQNRHVHRGARLVGVAAVVMLGTLVGCVPARAVDESQPLTQAVRDAIGSGNGTFPHDTFDALLKKHVKPGGRVDYAGLVGDKSQLSGYLSKLGSAKVASLSRNEVFALLINAYNAYTLDLIVRNYPLESIKDLSKPWDTEFCVVAGEKLTLNNIEHNFLRPKELFDDPRMHFAVNCASVGCPLLRGEAFVGVRIDSQLEDSTRSTLRDTRYVKLEGGKVHVTRVLDWFKQDFIGKYGSVSNFLKKYVTEEVAAVLATQGDSGIVYLDYDWGLNDTPK